MSHSETGGSFADGEGVYVLASLGAICDLCSRDITHFGVAICLLRKRDMSSLLSDVEQAFLREEGGRRTPDGRRARNLRFAIVFNLRVLPQSRIRSTGLAAARARSGSLPSPSPFGNPRSSLVRFGEPRFVPPLPK